MKKDHSFWDAVSSIEAHASIGQMPSTPFDVCLHDLHPGYQTVVRHEVERGALDHAVIDGRVWISRADLFELAGPGADQDDPDGGCYIPNQTLTEDISSN
jgi:hypothetical protein